MAAGDRSVSDVFQDIIRNVQEIIRSEVRLAKTEIGQEAAKTKTPFLTIAAGAVIAFFAMFFVLIALVDGLSLVMPHWAAALIVGISLAAVGAGILQTGVSRFKQINFALDRTGTTIKENVQWVKQQTK